tara:strand:- start:3290 stop:3820 length:531 start_codon:yes stop_codon:yes gene_type:complete
MTKNVTTQNSDLLQPLEEFLDRNHPSSDKYMRAVELIQSNIMHVTAKLRHKQVQIVKQAFTGARPKDIAQNVGASASSVSKIINSVDGQKLLQLLHYHQVMLEGPNMAQRRSMLWRIAGAEEETNPKTSIAAIESLNKMTFQDMEQKHIASPAAKGGNSVTININQDVLPRGALDA